LFSPGAVALVINRCQLDRKPSDVKGLPWRLQSRVGEAEGRASLCAPLPRAVQATIQRPVSAVYLVDASVYIFRAWYSQQPDQRDGEGNPTHALYGFARFLGDLIERRTPQYVAVAFDECRGSAHRHTLLPSYKASGFYLGARA
jgi:hypothetical protein